jgi:hypothetical protein
MPRFPTTDETAIVQAAIAEAYDKWVADQPEPARDGACGDGRDYALFAELMSAGGDQLAVFRRLIADNHGGAADRLRAARYWGLLEDVESAVDEPEELQRLRRHAVAVDLDSDDRVDLLGRIDLYLGEQSAANADARHRTRARSSR